MADSVPSPAPELPTGTTLDSAILRVLMDTLPDAIYFKDLASRFVWVNRAQARNLLAGAPEDCIGKSDHDFFAPEHANQAYADEQEIIRSGQPIISKTEYTPLRDGTEAWVSSTKLPWRDADGRVIGTFGLTRDITAAKVAGLKLEAERKLLQTIIDHIPARIFVKDADARYVLNNRAHLEALGVATQAEASGRTPLDFHPGERGAQAVADDRIVLSTGQPILNQEKSNFAAAGQVRWALTTKVPLHDHNGAISGLVGIAHDITERKLAEEEKARRSAEMEADVFMARQLQESFLSRPYPVFPRGVAPAASALRFTHCYVPATTLGGDFFEIIQFSDTRCGLLVCDVMGHGVRAGLLTAMIRGVVQEMGNRASDPAHVMSEINEALCPLLEQPGQALFATAFFGVIDLAERTLRFSNAGHPPPILVSDSSDIARLSLPDPEPATGLISGFNYSSRTVPFAAGDRLLAYTDGLIEAADRHGAFFGEERLCFYLGQAAAAPIERTCNELLRAVRDFTSDGGAIADDVCIVAIEGTRPGAPK